MNTGKAIKKTWLDDETKSLVVVEGPTGEWLRIKFQDQPIADVGNNGICMLDILDAMIDRLNQFEQKWSCEENRGAIAAFEYGKFWLLQKKARRLAERKQ